MAIVQVQELIDAGVHYGHRSSRWNPKMRPYIYGRRNLIHIIDLRETVRGLVRAYRFLFRVACQGSLILFVGTKRQAQEAVIRESKRCHMPFVCERWIGGTFTNFRTIRSRLQRLEELESLIRTGEINAYSKKRRSTLMRELRKIHRNLSGVRTMNRLPGAMVVVDSHKESSAVKEARKVGIPVVGLIDTDSDPDLVDLLIPGNDDSIRSIDLVLKILSNAVIDGLNTLAKDQVDKIRDDYDRAHSFVVPESVMDLGKALEPTPEPAAVAVESHEPVEMEASAPVEEAPAAPAEG